VARQAVAFLRTAFACLAAAERHLEPCVPGALPVALLGSMFCADVAFATWHPLACGGRRLLLCDPFPSDTLPTLYTTPALYPPICLPGSPSACYFACLLSREATSLLRISLG